jgi:hypothetical protein
VQRGVSEGVVHFVLKQAGEGRQLLEHYMIRLLRRVPSRGFVSCCVCVVCAAECALLGSPSPHHAHISVASLSALCLRLLCLCVSVFHPAHTHALLLAAPPPAPPCPCVRARPSVGSRMYSVTGYSPCPPYSSHFEAPKLPSPLVGVTNGHACAWTVGEPPCLAAPRCSHEVKLTDLFA